MEVVAKKSKILIVDDIAENLIALQMLLKKIDVDVVKAQSGKEALEATTKHDFDLVLLDVMMPVMDGYEVAERIHNSDRTAHIPIIFITAMDKNQASETRGYSKGAIDFLFKPINEVILLSKIKVHLELQKKRAYIRDTLDRHPTEKPKILIVDDNPENLVALQQILGRLDSEIIQVTSGNEALSATLYNDFALIILDVKMPGMDGYEVAEILKFDERTESIPIIFVTVMDNDTDQELRGYETGAVDYIVKPLNSFILLSKVKIFLELFRIKSALENLVRERNKDLQEANTHLSYQNKRLRDIVDSINRFASCGDINSFGNLILKEFSTHMDASGGSLYLVEQGGLRLIHSLDPDHAHMFISFPLAQNSILDRVISSGKPILTEDVNTLDNIKTSGWDGYTNNSILVFPLIENSESGKTIAVLALHNKLEPPFTSHDLEIGNILTSYVSESLRGTQFHEALLKSERQYRTLFEKANDAFFLIHRNSFEIIDANNSAQLLSGFDLNEIKDIKLTDIFFDHKSTIQQEIAESESAKELGKMTIIRKDKAFRIINLNIIPLDSSASICMAKDITSDLEIEKQLRQVQKMESIGVLAGGIAHDFNNLLSPMLGYSELMLKQLPDDSKFHSGAKEMHLAATRAKKLVQQILTFSHHEIGELAPVRIQPVLKEALELLRATIPATIEINQTVDESCGMVNGDPTLLHQIIMNLTTNAYHAMKETGGKLTLLLNETTLSKEKCVGVTLLPNTYACLTVADTGVGMDKNVMEKIFDPFFSTKSKGEGTGMGLSVVHGIVNKLGGSIQVDSEVGEGTVFKLYLPFVESEELSEEIVLQSSSPSHGTEKILFVDDEDAILSVTKDMLELYGYHVSTYNSSLLALENFRSNSKQYDLVITDLTMPGMTGDKFVKELLQINSDIPVIMLTGFVGDLAVTPAAELGIKGFLHKPVDINKLTYEIRKALDGTIRA